MYQMVRTYAERATEKLRAERQHCCVTSVFIRTSPHDKNKTFYNPQTSGRLTIPTNDTRDIIQVSTRAGPDLEPGFRYMKAGVMLSDFYSQDVAQLNLFDEYPPLLNNQALMRPSIGLIIQDAAPSGLPGRAFKKVGPWRRKCYHQVIQHATLIYRWSNKKPYRYIYTSIFPSIP
ncbi:MAG: umuC [Proteobacteria bacterium]|nr:umuC [Pseudomonadota bacterium]